MSNVLDNFIDTWYLILTENCNLACRYCFEPATRNCENKMSIETIQKSIDLAIENALKNKSDHVHYILFGGEPLTYPEGILHAVRYNERCCKQNNLGASYTLITNGTIYDEDFMNEYYKILGKRMRFQISLDGTPDIQDTNRLTAAGKPSSSLVINSIKKYINFLRDHDMRDKDIDKIIIIHSCISKQSVGKLYENYNYFKDELDVSFRHFAMVLEEPWDDNDVWEFDHQLNLLMRDALNKHLRFPMAGYGGVSIACQAGKYVLAISPEGKILGCPRIYFVTKKDSQILDKFIIGDLNIKDYIYSNKNNLLSDTTDKLIKEYDMEKNGRTKICMAANYANTGKLDSLPNKSLSKMIQLINQYKHYYNMISQAEGWNFPRNDRSNRKR